MALIKCSECGTEISDKAPACVKCGAPVTKPKAATPKGAVIGVIIGGIVLAWMAADSKPEAAPAKPNVTAKEPDCDKADLQCLGSKGMVAAGLYCREGIERFAKHSVRWTDGFLEPKFTHLRWKDKDAGIITYIGNRAEFQNGFGAYTPVIYECDIASDNKTVLDIRVVEGRLPT